MCRNADGDRCVLDKDGFVDTRATFERHDENSCGRGDNARRARPLGDEPGPAREDPN
jgi:hypothetical protein